jgi:hypothetical protein
MIHPLTKNLFKVKALSVEEITFTQKTNLLDFSLSDSSVSFYVVSGSAMFYSLDINSVVKDNIPVLTGETFIAPIDCAKVLIESLGTFDEDLKLIKIIYKDN